MENEKGREIKRDKVRESKVDVEKRKWLYYHGTYQNDKITLLLCNGGSIN